jgi:hypothetical protein
MTYAADPRVTEFFDIDKSRSRRSAAPRPAASWRRWPIRTGDSARSW